MLEFMAVNALVDSYILFMNIFLLLMKSNCEESSKMASEVKLKVYQPTFKGFIF